MRRRWWLAPLVLVLAFVVLCVWVRATFTPDRLRSLVQPRLEAALGRPVQLGSVRLSWFPVAVRLGDVRLPAPPGFTEPTLLTVREILLQPRLAPLLRRELVVRRVRIDHPEISLEQRADGTWNGATPARSAPPAGVTGGGHATPGSLTIESLSLVDGQVSVRSQPLDLVATAPLAAELGLHADAALRDVRLSGWATLDTLRGGATGKLRSLRGPRLRLEPSIRIDVPDSSATIESLRLVINDAVLDVQGTARSLRGRPDVHLHTRAESIDLAQLLAALPPGTTGKSGLQAAGSIGIDLDLVARPPALPQLHGHIALRDGRLQMSNLPEALTAIALQLEFAGDSLRVQDVSARLGPAPIRLSGLVLHPMLPMRTSFDLQIAAVLDLARLARTAPLPPGTSLSGQAQVDVRVRGRTAKPDSVWLQGPIVLRDVEARTPLVLLPVRAEARLMGAGDIVRIESAHLSAGTSALDVTGTLRPALPPKLPQLDFQGQAGRIDLVALLPPTAPAPGASTQTAPASGASTQNVPSAPAPGASTPKPPAAGAAPAATPLLPIAPPAIVRGTLRAGEIVLPAGVLQDARLDLRGDPNGMDVDLVAALLRADAVVLRGATGHLRIVAQRGQGTLRAARAELHKIAATDLEGDLAVDGRVATLTHLRGKAYDGALTGQATVDLQSPATPHYDLELAAESLDANTFLGSVTPLRNVVSGKLNLKSGWRYTGTEPKQILASLSGNGEAAALAGRLQNLPVLSALSALLRLPSLENLPYRDLGVHFAVESGRMAVRDLLLRAADTDIGVTGNIGLDGALDLGLHMQLSQEASKRYLAANRTAATLGSLFTDPSGRLVFDFAVGGDYRAPKLRPDLQKTARTAGVAALTASLLEQVLGRLPLPGIPAPPPPVTGAAPGDSARGPADAAATAEAARRRALEDATRRAAEEANRRLGGLFKRGTAPRDSTSKPDSAPRR